ncbi:serine/threonine-protein kinase brsk2-like protein [Anaeramoeba flamelloides]|uniref:Serine/threonine-protein kinase brsk2-like protein n=1 Tax=Anaeramoeba flamelloides TaxID=1746091 RepID=A0ABQ8ZDB3_9EUKA|nr:serine/threonine-protein kinase brsk2-like protein [Anaeramoeba flamelloides]
MSALFVGPYKIGKTLGIGSSSKVKLAVHQDSKKKVAIKILTKSSLTEKPQMRKKIEREISIMKLLKHPNIMRLYDVYETSKYLYLVLEYVSGGELFDFLLSEGSLSHQKSLFFFQQIIFGLSYLHERLICHRDLKPENLLIDENHCLKIADFGMSQIMKKGSLLKTSCGSPHYAAPEGIEYDGKKADVWCCGVILFALLSGRLPFDSKNMKVLLKKIKSGKYKMSPKFTNIEHDLIKRMLVVNPKKRISMRKIKKHPWFTSNFPDEYTPPDSSMKLTNVIALEKSLLSKVILKNLETLGWGNQKEITKALCNEEINQEKIFYFIYYKALKLKNLKEYFEKIKIQNELKKQQETNELFSSSSSLEDNSNNENEKINQEQEDSQEEEDSFQKSKPISIKKDNEENEMHNFQIGTPKFHRKKKKLIGSLPISFSPKKSWFGKLLKKKKKKKNQSLNLPNEESKTNKSIHQDELNEKENEKGKGKGREGGKGMEKKRETKPRMFFMEFEKELFQTITIFQKELTNLNFQWKFPSNNIINAKFQKNKMKFFFKYLKNEKRTELKIIYKSGDTQLYNKISRNLILKTCIN